MNLTKKTLIFVLLGLFIGSVLVDVDHLVIENGSLKLSNLQCIWSGFLSLTSHETQVCQANKEYGSRVFHDWRVGLFLASFVLSYFISLKYGGKSENTGKNC